MKKIKILFLAANPTDTTPLKLDEEVSAIDDELLKSRFRDKFDLEQKHAVRAELLSQHLLQVQPDIVHFSGHGSKSGEIILQNNYGETHPVRARSLGNLFSILKDNIRCVVLNACYSEVQAMIITRHIDCVIGMSRAISDDAAIKFAQGFYRGLGWGRDLKTAFKLGCTQIDLQNLDEESTPKIIWKNDEEKKIVFGEKQPKNHSIEPDFPLKKLTLEPKPKQIMFCRFCGAIPGKATECLAQGDRHNWQRSTPPIYCEHCGTKPSDRSLCKVTGYRHNFKYFGPKENHNSNTSKIDEQYSEIIAVIKQFIENPTRTNDIRAWKSYKKFIGELEQNEEYYNELTTVRNTIARLRNEQNNNEMQGLSQEASKIKSTIQNNYQYLLILIQQIQKTNNEKTN